MNVLYTIAIQLYFLAVLCAGFFSEKAKKWLVGRRRWNEKMKAVRWSSKVIWIHVASYGEFEQGKPVIQELKKKFPNYQVLLTFFSPSGYEKLKNYELVDEIFYLPLDTSANAKLFLDIVKPSIALFVRYEFWFNYLQELQNRHVPTVFFSASFRKEQLYFKFYGAWFLKVLKSCSLFLVRDEKSKEVLLENGITQVNVTGDTRFETVYENAQSQQVLPVIEEFKENHCLLVFGSTWEEDEQLILNYLNSKKSLDFKVIVAPHEIRRSRISTFQKQLKHKSSCYTEECKEDFSVLILDTIGVLKFVYRYANLTYVGGGFGKGIHNLLEPSVYGKPVLFGPNHHKFIEAQELQLLGLASEVNDQNFSNQLDKFRENETGFKLNNEEETSAYFARHIGVSTKVLRAIDEYLL